MLIEIGDCKQCGNPFVGELRPDRRLPRFCSRECHFVYQKSARVIVERFWKKVDIRGPDECWPWKTGQTRGGYGHFSYVREREKYLTINAHRFAYLITHKRIPRGLQVLHRCDNRICCNVAHLFLGTIRDNMQDKMNKGRQQRGEEVYQAKLTESSVRRIRKLYQDGFSQQRIADVYGVSQTQVGRICRRTRWQWVE